MNDNAVRAFGLIAGAGFLLSSHLASAQDPCANPANLTRTQQLVCVGDNGQGVVTNFGGSALALQQLSTQSDIRINTTSVASPTSISRDIQCLAARRNGAPAVGCPPDTAEAKGAKGRSAATHSVGPLGLTIVGSWGGGDEDSADDETGFDSRLRAFTAFIDYGFAEGLLAGVWLGYQDTELDFDFNSGDLDAEAYRGAVFVNYVPVPNVFLQGLVGYGDLDFESKRTCSACRDTLNDVPNPTRNTATYDGHQLFANLGGGYVLPLEPWSFGGYLRADYARTETDGYTEIPSVQGTFNELRVGSQRATSLTSTLGVSASYAAIAGGIGLTPSVRLEWVHEFKDDSRNIRSQFVGVSGTLPISVPTASPERNWANLGINLRASFTRSFGGFIDYTHLFKEDASFDLVSAGLRYEF